MKKVFFIATMAFTALFTNNSANAATTTVTENAETLTTRTETPMSILGEDMLKITITIHFKKWDLTIEIECMTAGGGGGGTNSGGTIEADGSVENNMLKIQLPETRNRDLAGASNYRIVKGGIFKLPNGEWLVVKEGQMLAPSAAGTLTCPVQKHNKTGHVTLNR